MSLSIFIGKGGMGKTTLATIAAMQVSSLERVLAVDMDESNKNLLHILSKEKRSNLIVMGAPRNRALFGEKRLKPIETYRAIISKAKEERTKHVIVDAPAGYRSVGIEEIIRKSDNIFLVLSAKYSELVAAKEFIKFLRDKGLVPKTIAVYNKWPTKKGGGFRQKLNLDIRRGLQEMEMIEKDWLQGCRTIIVLPEGEAIKKERPTPSFKKGINEIVSVISQSSLNRHFTSEEMKKKANRLKAVMYALSASLLLLLPPATKKVGEIGKATSYENRVVATEQYSKYGKFIDRVGFIRKAKHGDSVEGIAFWAFQRYSGFFDLDESGVREEWNRYRARMIRKNGRWLKVNDNVIVLPYEGKRSEGYFKNLLIIDIVDGILRDGKIVSPYFRVRSYGGKIGGHPGIDMEAPLGTAVRSFRSGKIVRSGFSSSYGYYVEVRDANDANMRYLYAHLARKGRKIRGYVKKGTILGYMGSTGRSEKPHLHFEVRVKAESGLWIDINPMNEFEREVKYRTSRFEELDARKY
ncbi:MAG: hypothetical protein D6769_00935 [Methanobacteriota archaeon]|nr:MAG: hypothetical protein D6769_00935 [Euryarchaeota archaeon]